MSILWPAQKEMRLTIDEVVSHRFHILTRTFKVEWCITMPLALILYADLGHG